MSEEEKTWTAAPGAPPGAAHQVHQTAPGLQPHEERTWGMIAHMSALAGYLIPLGFVLGPLVVWLMKKEQSAFVAHQAKEALNFQIGIMILLGVLFVVAFMSALVGFLGMIILLVPIAWLGIFALYIVATVYAIIAGVKANEGKAYRYPFSIRFVA